MLHLQIAVGEPILDDRYNAPEYHLSFDDGWPNPEEAYTFQIENVFIAIDACNYKIHHALLIHVYFKILESSSAHLWRNHEHLHRCLFAIAAAKAQLSY